MSDKKPKKPAKKKTPQEIDWRAKKAAEKRHAKEMGKKFDEEQARQRDKISKDGEERKIFEQEQGLDLQNIKKQVSEYESRKWKEKHAKSYMDEHIDKELSRFGVVYHPQDVFEEVEDILGNDETKEMLDDFFEALSNYQVYSRGLKTVKLAPTMSALLYGPPGTGKTSLVKAFSKKYDIPICVVQSESLLSALLGDTVKNITRLIDASAGIAEEFGKFVLFFDEIDSIGSERSNVHEIGEIKRAVISFLQALDKVSYEGVPLGIIGATNHESNLDSAIWRRFTYHFKFDFPSYELRRRIIESFIAKIERANVQQYRQHIDKTHNGSPSSEPMRIEIDGSINTRLSEEYDQIEAVRKELEAKLKHEVSEFEDVLWKELNKRNVEEGFLRLTRGYSGSDLERGTKVALLKTMKKGLLSYESLYDSLRIVGGTAEHLEKDR